MLWSEPAAIRVTPLSPAGMVTWPLEFVPQAWTVPADLSTIECTLPAAAATTPFTPAGTARLPPMPVFWPQVATVPSARTTSVWFVPAAIACTTPSPGGTAV